MSKEDFSQYGKDFQESLCHLMLIDRPFADQMYEVIDIGFLELKFLQAFIKLIQNYREKFGVHPSEDIMKTIMRSELGNELESVQQQIRGFFARIYRSDVADAEYIKATALDFCRKQKLKGAMLKSVKLLENSSFDEISQVINDALKLGADSNHGHDYIKDFEQRFIFKARNPVRTGWDEIDNITHQGLGNGELGVVIAPAGAGKSMALVHLGAQAVMDGKNVIYYTLELSETVVGSRFDSCITKVPLGSLKNFKEEIYEKIQDLEGKLIVKEYPTKSSSVATLKNHLEKVINRGFKPDVILVDYADLLRPISTLREKRHELETIYEQLRGLAQEYKCCVWTASQTNRSGLNAEVITMESISEAFNKCFVADFIFSISRTAEDKLNNQGRVFIAKNRNGVDGVIYPIYMNTSNITIKVLPSSGETIGEVQKEAKKRQEAKLKEKYAQFKSSNKKGKKDVT
jgi:archaellum biogenesis ATPase FlaH